MRMLYGDQLSAESGELNGVPISTWNISRQQSWMSMQGNMFTSNPDMSAIFLVMNQLRWKNFQLNE